MQLFWHGLSCVRIETASHDHEASLLTDPYDSETGLRLPRTLTPDVVALSHQDRKRFDLDALTNKPFVIADPGEFEVKEMFVYGIPLRTPEQESPYGLIYRFEIEGMSIGFLGDLNRTLTEEELGRLENIDILMLPVGGGDLLTPKQAIETINAIEPRIVVPLNYHVDGLKGELGTVDQFCTELGVCQRQDVTKLKIARKDLPTDAIVVSVIQRV